MGGGKASARQGAVIEHEERMWKIRRGINPLGDMGKGMRDVPHTCRATGRRMSNDSAERVNGPRVAGRIRDLSVGAVCARTLCTMRKASPLAGIKYLKG